MRSPLVSSRGPPELPGLMAASVWITFSMGRPVLPELISLPATCVRLLNISVNMKSMCYPILLDSFPTAVLQYMSCETYQTAGQHCFSMSTQTHACLCR